jgi:hypothetical protein
MRYELTEAAVLAQRLRPTISDERVRGKGEQELIWPLLLLALAAVLYFPKFRRALTAMLGGFLTTVGLIGLFGVAGALIAFVLACMALYRPGPRKR